MANEKLPQFMFSTFTKNEQNYPEEILLTTKQAGKLMFFSLTHFSLSFSVWFLINELQNSFSYTNYSLLHNFILVAKREKKSQRYLNFYTQLV